MNTAVRLLRVLVVDDDRDTANSFAMLARLWGHDVRVAFNGAAALKKASTYRPEVLLLDLAMPGMDGCALARRLRQTHRARSLLIAITGYADTAHHLLCTDAGFDHVLVKPADPHRLERLLQLEKIRRAATSRKSLRAPRASVVFVELDEDRPGAGWGGLLPTGRSRARNATFSASSKKRRATFAAN